MNKTASVFARAAAKIGKWNWLLSLLSGAVMALAFEPYDIGFIVWVGLLPILTILWTGPAKFWRGFFMAWLYGMGWYGVSFWWIHEVGYVFNIPLWLFLLIAFLPLMAVYSAMLGLWGGLVTTVLRPRLEAGPCTDGMNADKRKAAWADWAIRDTLSTVGSAAGVAAMFVCVDWLRSSGTLAFSWNTLGMGLYHGLSLVQWAEFVGTTALSFIPAFVAVILWGAGRRSYIYFKGAGRHCRTWDFYGTMVILFMLFMAGLFISKAYSPNAMLRKDSTLALPVLAVQVNKDQKEKIKERSLGLYDGNVPLLLETKKAAEAAVKQQMQKALDNEHGLAFTINQPAWVIWPESALAFDLCKDIEKNEIFADDRPVLLNTRQERAKYAYLRDYQFLAKDFLNHTLPNFHKELTQPFVLISGVDEHRFEPTDNGMLKMAGMLNSMVCISGTEMSTLQSAAKQHLMPFGEYIPLADSCQWIQDTYAEVTGTQVGDGIHPGSGSEPMVAPVPGKEETVGIIPAVCYEDTVGTKLTKFVRNGPQVIVNISNDAWFRHSACGAQQARNAAFRCIELRRSMVRAANMGYCCAIAPNGAVIDAQENPHSPGYSFAVLPVDRNGSFTLFAIAGDWAVVVCLLLVLARIGLYFYHKKA
ncbi:MAG: apolipoprotein N-acyltransferase [Akkermansia sp.]|nr:apolipoprotein N-acyltransferase [Akkermansia sp.]